MGSWGPDAIVPAFTEQVNVNDGLTRSNILTLTVP